MNGDMEAFKKSLPKTYSPACGCILKVSLPLVSNDTPQVAMVAFTGFDRLCEIHSVDVKQRDKMLSRAHQLLMMEHCTADRQAEFNDTDTYLKHLRKNGGS